MVRQFFKTYILKEAVEPFISMKSVEQLRKNICYVRCVGVEYNVVTSDNKLDVPKANEVQKKLWPNPKELPSVFNITADCINNAKPYPDECTYFFEQVNCIYEELKKRRAAGTL